MKEDEVVCDHAETCTQRLVVCQHQKNHKVHILTETMKCTDIGECSVAEIACKCIKVVR